MKRGATVSVLLGAVVLCLAGAPSVRAASNASVTGGGIRVFDGAADHVSINAIQKKDGSATGHFEQHDPDSNKLFVHGDVTCLDFINDTTVFVRGVLTEVHNVPPGFEFIQVGAPFFVVVQDNGNGSPADRITPYFVGDDGSPCHDANFVAEIAELVQVLFPELMAPLTEGNFQVSR